MTSTVLVLAEVRFTGDRTGPEKHSFFFERRRFHFPRQTLCLKIFFVVFSSAAFSSAHCRTPRNHRKVQEKETNPIT